MFFGWYVVAGTFTAQLFVVGFFTYAVSLLVAPVQAEFSAGLEQVMYSLTLATLFGLFAMPIGGILVDRCSSRWLMAVGCLLFAGGLYALSRASNIGQYVVLFGLTMALTNALAGAQPSATTVSRWFSVSRGRALGISALGTSVGGVLIPWLLSAWIATHGWRIALEYFAYAVALIMLPLVILTIRGNPEEAGLLPEASKAAQPVTAPQDALTMRQILTNPGYWFIGVPLGLLFSVYTATLANITPFATGLGVTVAQASQLITCIAVGGFIGKILFGVAADKISLKVGLWTALGLVFVGLLILSTEPEFTGMLLATSLMGLAAGGQLPVWGAMMARVFGLISYGRAMGLMSPLITTLVMPGFLLVGALVDKTGDYQLCLQIFVAIIAVAAMVLIPLRLDQPAN